MIAVAENDQQLGEVGCILYYADQPDKVQAWAGGAVSLWTGTSPDFLPRNCPCAPALLGIRVEPWVGHSKWHQRRSKDLTN
jgi:hypothetical protein